MPPFRFSKELHAVCAPCRSDSKRRISQSRCLVSRCTAAVDAFGLPDDAYDRTRVHSDGPMHRTAWEVRRAKLRAKLFFTLSMGLAIPLFILMSIIYPAVMLLDRYRRRIEHVANKVWAVMSTLPFVQVQVLYFRMRFCCPTPTGPIVHIVRRWRDWSICLWTVVLPSSLQTTRATWYAAASDLFCS